MLHICIWLTAEVDFLFLLHCIKGFVLVAAEAY